MKTPVLFLGIKVLLLLLNKFGDFSSGRILA